MGKEMKPTKLPPAVLRTSRRLKRPRSEEGDRIRSLLNRLQLIVPEAPKDRQLPQVQVIHHVINYICQLQDQVVHHPRFSKMQLPQHIADTLMEQMETHQDDAVDTTSSSRDTPLPS